MGRANDEKAALFDKEIYFTACVTIYICSNCYCILPQPIIHTHSGYSIDCRSLVSGLPFHIIVRFL